MILDKLIRRRWQHPDTTIRRQAVADLEPGHPALLGIAQNDADVGVRSAALSGMNDFDQVLEIGVHTDSRKVREAAVSRLCGLLGAADTALDVQACLQRLQAAELTGVGEKLCRRGKSSDVRMLALAFVHDQSVLMEVSSEDPVADVRYAAVTGIHDRKLLEQVQRQARKKDKRVARYAKDCLAALAARDKALHRMAELCTALEALQSSPTDDLRVKRLLDEAEPLREQVNDVLRERLELAHENWLEARALDERMKAELAEAVAKHESLLESMEQICVDLKGRNELSARDDANLDAAMRTFHKSWEDADPLPDSSARKLNDRYRGLRENIAHQRAVLRDNHDRAEALRAVDQEARAQIAESASASAEELEQAMESLRKKAAGLPWPQDKSLHGELAASLKESLGEAKTQVDNVRGRKLEEEMESLLTTLERAVEGGEAKAATNAESRIRGLLKAHPKPQTETMKVLDAQFRGLAAKLQELRDWRRWGSSKAREEILSHIENLPDLETDPEKLALAVREARSAWQRMDKAGDRPAEGLWERFDQACTKAYEPCTAFFEEKARQRAACLAAREAVISGFKDLASEADWNQPDWKGLDRKVRDLKRKWRESGTVERRDWLKIEPRFKQAVAPLEGPLQEEQKRNLEERKRLIDRVEGFAEATDVRRVVEETKRAQRDWKVTVPQGRKQEQKLWDRFRAACDVVFERQREERDARDQAMNEILEIRRQLCEKAEALVAAGGEEVLTELRAMKKEWDAAGSLPRKKAEPLDIRWAAAGAAAQEQRAQRQLLQLRESPSALARLVEALIQAEEAAISAEAALIYEVPDDPRLADRVAMLQAAQGEGNEGSDALKITAETLSSQALDLCIQAEILAGLESREEDAQRRMALQVERLQSGLGTRAEGMEARVRDAAELETQWWLLGPLSRSDRAMIGPRIQSALDSVWATK